MASLRLEVDPGAIAGKYYTVPHPQESWSQPPKLVDSFQLDTKTHKLANRKRRPGQP